ncbi:MAG TPA: tetratricopeptide repeat protein, partial [Pseudomonadales bacterium]|nr:tetratricopeptide repeat protein [Pseudomonadales bacterium]
MLQGQYAGADARYDQALQAAQQAGDRELLGPILQHQGKLAKDRQQYDRAIKLYQRALQAFQEIHDEGSIMRTCNLLGVVEQNAGRLAEARAWYERSR